MIGHLLSSIHRMWLIKSDPNRYARSIGVQMGRDCRLLGLEFTTFGSEPYLVKLGDHVTITSGVRFITHDGGVWVFRKEHPNIDVIAPIVVGNNVFIGINSILMPGVTIGDDCVIGAGSVVTRDVASGAVVAGVPARPIQTIAEYWQKVEGRAVHIRSLPEVQKRALLVTNFRVQDARE